MIKDNQLPPVPASDLIFLLFRARQSVYRIQERDVSRHGVTLEQATVMELIHGNRDISIGDICRIMIREHHTITSLIRRMVKNDLVIVTKGSRGKISLALTPQGSSILGQMTTEDDSVKLVSTLDDVEQRRLAYYLLKVTKNALKEFGKLEEYNIPGGFAGNIPEE
ncbi:MarR family winged helix-turn-helix transcriptional regulator [Dehalogenimonas etheniformans]|uniref:MarR family transcriptional regulator n=1 Tax=Dehalogenimonas etheniformans TaxID=1536648 RepID=A0A2P5P5H5_9CHLR|nr:helix-turn-helix domain-containing protein [Dehalogenimonas etheniformans]PPD57540.1 MarR family transcriptional regulator [Dehalogenimonas etheniformans]QNT76900.1 MarR family transcriptional regulator [Dehalogenimonas etheniformans]